jgi:hypothetical protein
VPAVAEDLDCGDLAQWGISEVRVAGEDVYDLDRDGDGTGCENNVPAKATGFGDAVADFAPIATVLTAIVLLVVCVWPVHWAWRAYRQAADDVERRGMAFNAAMTLIAAFALALLSAFLFAAVGIER